MSHIEKRRAFALEVVEKLTAAGHQALWAGGCVRDLLLSREPGDFDVATAAHPDQVRGVFGTRRTFSVGAAFGVILVRGPGESGTVEVATFRSEGPYTDGRHPDHVTFATVEDDAARRDFTINGMFLDPRQNGLEGLIDLFGGQDDLRRRVVRAIGNPTDRLSEDKLRMLRAVRFAATLDFQIEQKTLEAVQRLAPQINVVSAERIAIEWKRMLVDPSRCHALELADETGLLDVVFPELAGVEREPLRQRMAALDDVSFPLALAALLLECPDVEAVCRRLKLSNDETSSTLWLVEQRDALEAAADQRLSRLKPTLAHTLSAPLMQLVQARTGGRSDDVEFCRAYLQKTPSEELEPPPLLTGDDLIDAGLSPGPEFTRLLGQVRDAQLEGRVQTGDQALKLVFEMRGLDE